MAQLVEWSLPTPDIVFAVNWIEKTKIKKREAGKPHLKKQPTGHFYLLFKYIYLLIIKLIYSVV